MRKVYIAGKVSGLHPDEVRKKFNEKSSQLIALGCNVFNTVEYMIHNYLENAPWEDIMKVCIVKMLECNEVHMLPCWKSSRGARMERNLAIRLGMPIVYHKN